MSEKVKEILEKILFWGIVVIIMWVAFCLIVNISMLLWYDGSNIPMVIMLATILIDIAIIFILRKGREFRCPTCKKLFALKEVRNVKVDSKDIFVSVKTKSRNNDGDIVGTQEQYVPGERIKYRRDYICKKCGAECYQTYTRDNANI